MNLKRLPVKGVLNLRDLGGYPAESGRATKWKMIFRADGLFGLDKTDMDIIMAYCKPNTVIDLRGTKEQALRPNSFKDCVNFLSVPLISEDRDYKDIEYEWRKLETAYAALLEHSKRQVRHVIEAVADSLPGPVLYNCTAGKDRTGIISALILGVCGVDDYDIISDYQISSTYIRRDLNKVIEPGKKLNMEHVASPPKAMKSALSFIKENYGSIPGFLEACGVSPPLLDKIKEHFLVSYTV